MKKPLIIFDCDGVLVDTEGPANTRIAAYFTQLGYPLTMTQSRRKFQGKSVKDLSVELERETGTLVDPEVISNQINDELTGGIHAIEGVETLLNQLIKNGIPFCVASSGSVEKMHMTLGQTSLLPLVKDKLFSSSMVTRGKPFPDVFEYAAAQMDHDIHSAFVIEDSVTGVIAGAASGAQVLGFCGDPFNDPSAMKTAGATVFQHMSQVMEMIEFGSA